MGLTPPLERIVIFGASGFVGGVVARHFKEAGDTPVVCYSSRDFNLLDPAQAQAASQTLRAGDAVVWSSAITRRVEESWEALQKTRKWSEIYCGGFHPWGFAHCSLSAQ